MKRFVLGFLLLFVGFGFAGPAFAENDRLIYDDGVNDSRQVDQTHGLPVQVIGGGSSGTPTVVYQKTPGTTTWTKTTVALTGASQTALAASTTRVGFIFYNPSTNGNVFVGVDGGTVASETGVLLSPGGRMSITGSASPKTIITVIGTNTQSLIVWEGN